MVLFLNILIVLILTSWTSAFFLNLKKIEEFEKKYNLEFLKDYFKFPIYINPHPHCALEDEECTLDTNCCGGKECKMVVDGEGIKYTCQEKIVDKSNGTVTETEDEEEEEWDSQESTKSNSLFGEVYKAKLEELNKADQNLVDDQYYMIKELQKPLTLDEMRELQQVKEIEDYKRENKLKELRKWAETKKEREKEKRENENRLKALAIERVAKVLKEEEEQKKAMFNQKI